MFVMYQIFINAVKNFIWRDPNYGPFFKQFLMQLLIFLLIMKIWPFQLLNPRPISCFNSFEWTKYSWLTINIRLLLANDNHQDILSYIGILCLVSRYFTIWRRTKTLNTTATTLLLLIMFKKCKIIG